MQLSDLEKQLARFEQQLRSFELLHGGETQTLKQQLEAIQKIQQGELQTLHEQLNQLKESLAAYKVAEENRVSGPVATSNNDATPVELTVTRREMLTGRVFGKKN